MNTIDIIILVLFSIFFSLGYQKGLLKTIAGPVALVIGGIIGYKYFKETGNIVTSLVISIVLPFIINFVFSFILNLFKKKKDENKAPSLSINGVLGGFLNVAWSGALTLLVLLCIVFLPSNTPYIGRVQGAIKESNTYAFLNQLIEGKTQSKAYDLNAISNIINDPKSVEKVQNTDEFKNVMKDKKVKALMNDEKLVEQMQDKNYLAVMQHPKIKELLNDEESVKKILELQKQMLQ